MYFNIGEMYSARPAGNGAEARKAYERSLELLLELRRKGVLPAEYDGKPDQIIRKIALLEAHTRPATR